MNSFTDVTPSREHMARVLDAFCRRIEHYFEDQALHQHQIDIRVEVREVGRPADDRALRCNLAFVMADGARVGGVLLIRFLGGNMYEADATVADRMRRFTLCLPHPSAAAEEGSAGRVCDYLFDEVKRSAGERYLRTLSSRLHSGEETR